MLRLVLLLCALMAALSAVNNCTLTQTGWRLSPALLLESGASCSLCGLGAEDLLTVDVARLREPQNAEWVLGAHQYCAGVLNMAAVGADCDTNSTGIAAAVARLGDSLQYVCGNVSQWSLLAQADAYQTALLFNQGQYFGCAACPPANASNVTTDGPSFYYYQDPDIVTLRLLDNNTTLSYSLYRGRYNTILALTVYLLVSLVVIVALLLAIVVLNNRNRLYELGRPARWDEVNTSHLDHTGTQSEAGDASENELVFSRDQSLHDEL